MSSQRMENVTEKSVVECCQCSPFSKKNAIGIHFRNLKKMLNCYLGYNHLCDMKCCIFQSEMEKTKMRDVDLPLDASNVYVSNIEVLRKIGFKTSKYDIKRTEIESWNYYEELNKNNILMVMLGEEYYAKALLCIIYI